MRDRDIRSALRQHLLSIHDQPPDTLILNELGLCSGAARVDVAVVNGSLNGYEIKSARDTLERLPGQAEIYGRTLDSVTVVASGSHLGKIKGMVPRWWGIMEAVAGPKGVVLSEIRSAKTNPAIEVLSVVQLLWREEALSILKDLGLDKGMHSKPRRVLWETIARALSRRQLRETVRRCLKSRPNWRSAA